MGLFSDDWEKVGSEGERIALGETPHVRRMRGGAEKRLYASGDTDYAARLGQEMASRRAQDVGSSGGLRSDTSGVDEALLASARIRGEQQNLQERVQAAEDLRAADDWNRQQENLKLAYRQRAINKILQDRAARNAMLLRLAQTGAMFIPGVGPAVSAGIGVAGSLSGMGAGGGTPGARSVSIREARGIPRY